MTGATLKWPLKSLGDVAAKVPYAIVDGPFGSSMKSSDYVASGVPVLQGKNITNDLFRWFDIRYLSKEKAVELKRSSVRVDDILLVKIGSIGYAAVIDSLAGHDHAIIPANLAKITPDKDVIDTRYLFRLLTSPDSKRYFQSNASKTAQPALSLGKIKALPVPLPPIPEQRRIAAILDQADALRAKRREALAQLDSLTHSTFIEMFGDPATNPMSWPVHTIEQLCKVKGGKRLPKGADYSPIPTQFRYVRVTDMKGGKVDESNLHYLTPEVQSKIARYIVNTGDVIVSIAGSIGVIAVVPKSLNGANLTENAAKLVARTHADYIPDFLAFMLRMKATQSQIESHVGQVTIGKLALFRIEKLFIPLPPLHLQQAFASRIQMVERLKATHRAALQELDTLFASLQHRAFRGEL